MMCDDRHFLGEAFDVLGFLGDEAHRYEDREITIIKAKRLNPIVKLTLQEFPYAVTPRLDDHAAANWRWLGHVRVADNGLIPFRKVFSASDGESVLGHGGYIAQWGEEAL